MTGNFYRVRCSDCENEQVVFGRASTTVNCAVCGTILVSPTGGEADIPHEIVDTVEHRTDTARTDAEP